MFLRVFLFDVSVLAREEVLKQSPFFSLLFKAFKEQWRPLPDGTKHATIKRGGGWGTEPRMGRILDGVSGRVHRVDRLKALGNAVVPQVAYHVGLKVREVLGLPGIEQ